MVGEIGEKRIEDRSADGIDRDVDAARIFAGQNRADVLGPIVDGALGSQRGDKGAFLCAARHADDPAAFQHRQLHQQMPQAAGRSGNRDGFATLHLADAFERNHRRHAGRCQRQIIARRRRGRGKAARRAGIRLAIAAGEAHGDRGIADGKASYRFAHRLDHADRLDAGKGRQRDPDIIDRVARDLGVENPVHPAIQVAHADLAALRLCQRQGDDLGPFTEGGRDPLQPDRAIALLRHALIPLPA